MKMHLKIDVVGSVVRVCHIIIWLLQYSSIGDTRVHCCSIAPFIGTFLSNSCEPHVKIQLSELTSSFWNGSKQRILTRRTTPGTWQSQNMEVWSMCRLLLPLYIVRYVSTDTNRPSSSNHQCQCPHVNPQCPHTRSQSLWSCPRCTLSKRPAMKVSRQRTSQR